MAARKSCTHLTWGEAKSRSGQASSSSSSSVGQKKNKENLRKQDHGAVLAAKIISKQGGNVASAENKKIQKQYRKIEEKSAAIAASRLEEREQKRLAALQEVKPYDRIKEKVSEMLQELKDSEEKDATALAKIATDLDLNKEEIQTKIVECKQMQVDEIMAFEAMMILGEDFVISKASKIDELREKLEQYEASGGDDATIFSIVNHPPICYTIRLEVDDYRDAKESGTEDMELNAILLLQVTLPPLYLNNSIDDDCQDGATRSHQVPDWKFKYVMVSDKNVYCSADKSLESMAWLDEKGILAEMNTYANDELLPYPCIYEVAVTWLSEHVFDFLHLQSHLLQTTTK